MIRDPDFGTKPGTSETMVTLSIDGQRVTVPEGTSIMRAAMDAGVKVPRLCATDLLDAFGSCRLCLVEIEGRAGTPASCTTPVAPDLKVATRSERLDRIRRGVMELYLSDHPDDLQGEMAETAREVGVATTRYGKAGVNHLSAPVDASNPYFRFDPAKCIVCSRCVRACAEVQGTFALTVQGRGFGSEIVASMDEPFLTSECVSCGACVQACPTGSLLEKSVVELGEPERVVVTTCAYCGVGCNFRAEMKGDTVIRMVPSKDGKANHGHSCVKGRFAWGYTTHRERILKPMMRDKITDPWQETTWEAAIARVARDFRRIQEQHGIGAIGAITSSRCTNEETYLMQKLVRAGFRNNNIDTCARVCHSPTGYGLGTAFGTSAGTNDFDSVDAVRRGSADRRQSDRCASGVRLADEAALPSGREADRRRSASHRPGAHAACRGGVPSAAASRHQRRHAGRAGACRRDRGAGRRGVCPRTLRLGCVPGLGRVHRRTAQQPGGSGEFSGVPARAGPRGGAALRGCPERRDLLRARRYRAQPGQHRGHGAGQPRDGDRQCRPAGDRGEPAARAEQRAGLLRHGQLPARVLRLPPRRQRRRARRSSRSYGA